MAIDIPVSSFSNMTSQNYCFKEVSNDSHKSFISATKNLIDNKWLEEILHDTENVLEARDDFEWFV